MKTYPFLTQVKNNTIFLEKNPITFTLQKRHRANQYVLTGLRIAKARFPKRTLRFETYYDKDGSEHKSISDNPFIVLSADNSNQLKH